LLQVHPAFHLHDDKSGFRQKNVALRYEKTTLRLQLTPAAEMATVRGQIGGEPEREAKSCQAEWLTGQGYGLDV
jgi:hypothetical protein